MAALNFPLSPEDGDVYGNYVYDATEGVWNANPQQLASRFVTSATQPTSPSNGDGWLDTNTGKTYIYYNDGSSAQWIESGNPVIGFVDPYDQDSTSTGYFSLPKGTSAQRPVAPSNGDIRFNTESGTPEWYSSEYNTWINFSQVPEIEVEYVVVAGGGSGAAIRDDFGSGGGGGAGGYRSSVAGESSGGGGSAEQPLSLSKGTYGITVGAGAPATTTPSPGDYPGSEGSASLFASISSSGGGRGGGWTAISDVPTTGGSGGGGGVNWFSGTVRQVGAAGTAGEGYAGGDGGTDGTNNGGGGGGGAGAVGANGSTSGGNGGAGVASSITGSSVICAGGGGGSDPNTSGAGGAGGGGAGSTNGNATDGTANTGGGGGSAHGAGGGANVTSGAGGSGVVIFKVPSWSTPTFSVGLTEANGGNGQTIGDYTVYTVTAGTGTVTF